MISHDAWLCPDCAETAGEHANDNLSWNYDSETGEGFTEFSKSPCWLCQSPLYGQRYRFWVTVPDEFDGEGEPVAGRTMPCQTCGTPVDTDTWHEELGFCIPCQHDYFDHSDEEN